MKAGPTAWVVDASVAVKLVHPEPLAEAADSLLNDLSPPVSAAGFVPDLFYAECANVIWKHARRLGEPVSVAAQDLGRLRNLGLRIVRTYELADDALEIALLHGSTAYDSCYVALSEGLRVPLITADEALVRRFERTAYQVLWLGDPALGLV